MSHKVWWLAGLVVLGLAGSVVAYRGFHASASIARGSKASATAEARAQNPAAPSDVQRLRSELALVQGQMVGLRPSRVAPARSAFATFSATAHWKRSRRNFAKSREVRRSDD